MRHFSEIFDQAARFHGGEEALEKRLDQPLDQAALQSIANDRWLAMATKCIFQAGFNWELIEKKWPNFEAAFEGFDLDRWALMHDDDLDRLLKAPGIVANGAKIQSVGRNARYFCDLVDQFGSLGAYFSSWTLSEYCQNILSLKQKGDRLGGRCGQIFLRRMGMDALIFSDDVVKALIEDGVVSKMPSSQKDHLAVQEAINRWHEQSGRGLTQMSQILAFSVG